MMLPSFIDQKFKLAKAVFSTKNILRSCRFRRGKVSIFYSAYCLAPALTALALLSVSKGSAQTSIPQITLHQFSQIFNDDGLNSDGSYPSTGVIQGTDGNFYGTTYSGGPAGNGTAFQLTPTGTLTVIHVFTSGGTPKGLIQGKDGNLYGVVARTTTGGYSPGILYRLTTAGEFTVLYNLYPGGYTNGPEAKLLEDKDGNLYGTGADSSIFRFAPDGTYTMLYTPDRYGVRTESSLLQELDGTLYGTTYNGGGAYYYGGYNGGCGTIFKLTPSGVFTNLHTFSALDANGNNADGCHPTGDLIRGSDGNFYGTTQEGGRTGQGTIFRLTPTGDLTVIYNFVARGNDVSLVAGRDGNLYGTNELGGVKGAGQVFRMTLDGVYTPLYDFKGEEGAYPTNGLIQARDGNLYGTTLRGANKTGTVFEIVLAVPPTINSLMNANGRAGTAFSYQIVASDTPVSYAASGLPAGLSVDSTSGLISGTPTETGIFPVTLSATNAGGTGTATLTLLIEAALPTVSLVATIPQVTAGTDNFAEFTLGLSAAQDHDVTINFVVKGSAVNGTDYVLLRTAKKIKAGKTSKSIKIIPLGEGPGDGGIRAVTLTLAPGSGYTIGTAGKVKVKIVGR